MEQNSPKNEEKGYNLRKRTEKKTYKSHESSDDSGSEYIPPKSDDETDSETEEFNMKEYRKFLYKVFPSKHLEDKIKKDSLDEDSDAVVSTPKIKRKRRLRPVLVVDDDSNSDEGKNADGENNSSSEDDSETDDEYDTEEGAFNLMSLLQPRGTGGKSMSDYNIIFTIGNDKFMDGLHTQEDTDTDEDSSDDSSEGEDGNNESKENEVIKVKSPAVMCQNKKRKKPTTEKTEKQTTPKTFTPSCSTSKKSKNSKTKKSSTDTSLSETEVENYKMLKSLLSVKKECSDSEDNESELSTVKKSLLDKFDKIVEEEEKKHEKRRLKAERKRKIKNTREFKKMLNEDRAPSEVSYFKKMDFDKQVTIIEEMKKIKEHMEVTVPYRIQLIERDIPVEYKSIAMKKINVLSLMDPGSGEYYKIKKWVDTFMTIPFGNYNTLPLSIDDGPELCSAFMMNAKKILDDCVYGLNDAKMQILQVVGQWISNPNSMGTAVAIKGPMGTGKTTLVKEGISKILQRPFSFIALGGATDSAFLEGHSYTYEGSRWGHIVEILRTSKCMNPVIYFDELDKVSDTPKGEEITGILTHLTDTTQNTQYHDKYFSGIDFNLSKCLFIFSYNEEKKVNPILRDRMYCITTKGYDTKEKIIIAKKHLIPGIEVNVGFESGEIVFDDAVLTHIITTHTKKERGVRNLKRCIEIIFTKLNLYRLMRPEDKLYDEVETIEITSPFAVTVELVDSMIKKGECEFERYKHIYV